jgi:cellulose synthase (UDP-forming)
MKSYLLLLFTQPVTLLIALFATIASLWVLNPRLRVSLFQRLAILWPNLRIAAVGLLIVAIDLAALKYFNTINWPQQWPNYGVYLVLTLVATAIWFREYLSGIWGVRIIGCAAVFIGQCYFIHSFEIVTHTFSLVALIHCLGVAGTVFVTTLNVINQSMPRVRVQPPELPAKLPYVAVVIPTYGEPYDILEQTVVALKALNYPRDHMRIIISDDGHRAEIRQMAQNQGILYNQGARKDAKAGNLNSALAYIEQHYPEATLILTQDADEIIDPNFLIKTVGYFADPKVAFVQTPKEAFVPYGDPFGNRDRVFYDTFQPGRHGSGAAFSCGSGVIWQIAAVRSIGGFVTWNIVEDLTTSYHLHSAGYRSEYHSETLSIGLSPDDIPGLLKQRGTWATDTWRLFLFDNPIRKPGLTLRQRLQYLELGLFYTSSVTFLPMLMFTPFLSLATGQFIPIDGSALFPWIAAIALYYAALSRGSAEFTIRMWQYWIGHWPTYTKALWIAARSRHKKPSYQVTRKTRQDGFYGHLIWPQFVYLFIGAFLIVRAMFWMPEASLMARITNIGLLGLFMFLIGGICRAAFYNVSARVVLTTIGGYFTIPLANAWELLATQSGRLRSLIVQRQSSAGTPPVALVDTPRVVIIEQPPIEILLEREVGR